MKKLPLIALNFKAYNESLGENGRRLAQFAERVSAETGVRIIVAPQFVDLWNITNSMKVEVFAQHTDSNEPGAFTGTNTAEAIKAAGATGSLVNHSERRLPKKEIALVVNRLKKNGLQSMLCAATSAETVELAESLSPTFVAIEPPELIGTGISVSKARPEVVKKAVADVTARCSVPVLCGAGISNGTDVKKAIELGAQGVLLASAFVKAKNPKDLLLEMARAL